MKKLKRSILYWILLSPMVVLTLFPFAVMFITAIKPAPEMLAPTGALIGLDAVRAAVNRRVRMFPSATVAIELSTLADQAGLYGAVALAMRHGNL